MSQPPAHAANPAGAAEAAPVRAPRLRLLASSSFRLALVYMALFGGSALVLLAFIYWTASSFMAEQTDQTIQAEVRGLADRYRTQGLPGLLESIERRLARRPTGSAVYLLIAADGRNLIGNINRWPEAPASAEGWLDFRLAEASAPGEPAHRARARAFVLSGGFQLLVGRDMAELERLRALMARTLGWGLLVTLLLALGGGVAMARSTGRRIEAINQTSREIVEGDLSRRVPTRGSNDDFDRLAANLNDMLDRIQALMESVRQVSDNIAHDLKTPLTRLRNRLEGLRASDDDPRIDEALAEADALLTTFRALLRIARIEAGEGRGEFRQVSLARLLADVADLYAPVAEARGQTLELRLPGETTVDGDRDLLFQAFANLVDNAVKYTPEDGRVTLALELPAAPAPERAPRERGGGAAYRGPGPRVRISDTGPGVPAEERERVFRRFYRADASRSTPGNGLGLSLVAAVARLHGASVLLDGEHGLSAVFAFDDRRLPPPAAAKQAAATVG